MNSNEVILIILVCSGTFLALTVGLLLFFVQFKRRQRRHITEKLELAHVYETTLLKARLEVQEQSFRYISGEIHDNVGGMLSLCKLQLHEIGFACSGTPAEEIARNTTELLSKAITELRSISHTMNGDYIERLGLRDALVKEINYFTASKLIKVHLTIVGDEVQLPAESELLIFRIIQESITNALKHAHPSEVKVDLRYSPTILAIQISDDGEGFDTDKVPVNGMGIDNIYARAALLNGMVSIKSQPTMGSIVELKIPIPNAKHW